MEKSALWEKQTIEQLVETLQQLPEARAHSPRWQVTVPNKRGRIDAEIDFIVGDRNYLIIVEAKKSLFPRDVRQALWQLQDYARALGHNKSVIPLLAAESISPGSKEMLRNEKVGYYDSGGSLFIPARGAYVYIDKPPPKSLAKSVRALFKGKRAQVLHALLHDPEEWFGVKTLAQIAQVSSATVSETLVAIERFDWLESRGLGPSKERRLIEPTALLDEWKKQILAGPKLSVRRYYVSGASDCEKLANRLGALLNEHDLDYALTQEVAAQRYAPFLSSLGRVACRVAPERRLERVIKELDAREVTEGTNLHIIDTRSESAFIFKERIGSVWLASPVQVYLDLLLASGRAQEMAEHLRRERIGF
jgi:hypothetical protein